MYIILTFQVIYKAERRRQQIAPNTVTQKLLVFKFDDNSDNSINQSLNRPLSVLTYKSEDGQIDRGKEGKKERGRGGR